MKDPLSDQYDMMMADTEGFKEFAERLRKANWSKSNIIMHWEDLQNDDEAGDADIP